MSEEKSLDGGGELASLLDVPDSIMESDVTARLKVFMSQGGEPAEAIRLLSTSYKGVGEMANFAVSLLCSFGDSEITVHKLIADHLRTMLVNKFDQKAADSVLQREAMPEWLEMMLADPSYHSCLSTLSEKHPSSLLLKYAMLKMHEYDAKLSSSSFQTFTGALIPKLAELLLCPDNSSALMGELQVFACQSAFEYLFTQRLLYTLRNSNNAQHRGEVARAILKRLSQELSMYAQKQHGPLVHSLDIFAQDLGRFPLNTGQALTEADVSKLHMLCSSPGTLPVEFLRNPQVIRGLLDAAYSPGHVTQPPNQAKMIHLLAVASLLPAGTVSSLPQGVSKVSAALSTVLAQFSAKAFSMASLQFRDTVLKHVDLPIVAAAFTMWVSKLLKESYYDEVIYTLCTDMFFYFLSEIANRFPLLHQQVFEVVSQALLAEWLPPLVTSELKTKALRMLVHLIHLGCLKPVFSLLVEEVSRLDYALVRYFLVTLVSSLAPPFSDEFTECLAGLLMQPSALNSVAHSLSVEDRQKLNQVVQHMLSEKQLLPLQTSKLQKYLST